MRKGPTLHTCEHLACLPNKNNKQSYGQQQKNICHACFIFPLLGPLEILMLVIDIRKLILPAFCTHQHCQATLDQCPLFHCC